MSRAKRASPRGGVDIAAVMAAGIAAHRAGQLAEAMAHYDRVLAADRNHAGATHLKGVALLQSNDLAAAEQVLVRAVKLKSGNAPAHSDLGLCLLRLGRPGEAVAAFSAAIRAMPDAAEAYANRGHALALIERHGEALANFERAMALQPGNAEFAVHHAAALLRLGRHAEAVVGIGRVLATAPRHPVALKVKGDIAAAMGRGEEAVDCYGLAIEVAPDHVDARLARGGYWLLEGEGGRALEDYDAVLAALPGLGAALAGRGAALLLLDRAGEAVDDLVRAIEIGPVDASVCTNLALALNVVGRFDQALAAAERATGLDVTLASAWLVRANALSGLARLEEAIEYYDRAIGLKADLLEGRYGKACVLRRLNRGDEAIAVCDELLAIDPSHYEARWLKVFSVLPAVPWETADVTAARERLDRDLGELERIDRGPDDWVAVGRIKPFYLTYHEADNRPLLTRYGRLCHQLMSEWQSRQGLSQPSARRAVDGRIRLGVVSSDFSRHSVWTAITRGWVSGLDRERFELHLFGTGDVIDEQSRLVLESATSFVHGQRGMRQWVDAIQACDPDVIIYPEIGVDPVSLRLASLRLASLQAVTWGHPDTTGLPTMDAYLSGDAFEPEGAEAHYSERLVRLPGLGVKYAALGIEPDPFVLERFELTGDRPLLVAPGTPFKYAPEFDAVLVEVARRVGNGQIVMFEPKFYPEAFFGRLKQRLARAFTAAGLDMDRHVKVLPWLKPSEFYGLMHRADAFLDTIGFSGFNTAMQAVECGLPIVTREGRFLRGRLASALYREMGMPELIAPDEAAYVELAVRLATDRAYRDSIRDRIVAARDVLFDDDRPVRALEAWLEDVVRGREGH